MTTTPAGAKVLIVAEEGAIVPVLVELIERQGLTTVVATDGESALERIRQERPDLLLVDYKFPEKNGLEVMRRAKQLDEHLPVVLITAFAHVRGAVEAIRAGAHDYLAKPFENHEIVQVVEAALAERSRRELHEPTCRFVREEPLRETLGPSDTVTGLIAA